MYRGFRQSRAAMAVTFALTLVLMVLVWRRNAGRELYIPIVASALLLAIGGIAARLLGNIVSSAACTSLLGKLHMDLDPNAFLEGFQPVAKAVAPEGRDGMVCRFYLSDGYAAAGAYDQAQKVLGDLPAHFRFDAPVAGVYWGDLARAQIGLGLLPQARQSIRELEAVISGCGDKPALRQNLQDTATLLKAACDVRQGKAIETDTWQQRLNAAPYKLRALEIQQILALDAQNREDQKALRGILTRMQQNGGKTIYHKWAVEQSK